MATPCSVKTKGGADFGLVDVVTICDEISAHSFGIPVAIFLSERYLRQFWYRIDHYGWVFVAGAFIALAISFLAVLWQTLKAAKTNPAEELKKE